MFAIFNEKPHCPGGKFYNLVFYQSERTRMRMATAQVIEKSISMRYSEIGYIILRVFDENVIKKWLILDKTAIDSCMARDRIRKNSS